MRTSGKYSRRFLSQCLLLLSIPIECRGWTSIQGLLFRPISQTETRMASVADSKGNGVQTVDLGSIDDDHEKEGQLMADSVIAWLDAEWIPQQVHIDMAESAKRSYIQCRESGQKDVMDVMMQISNDLDKNWAKYNDDAFVNAWDIGNYCSDYLGKIDSPFLHKDIVVDRAIRSFEAPTIVYASSQNRFSLRVNFVLAV